MDCSPPGSSVRGILQARILEWPEHSLLLGFFPTQGWNLGLPHCRWILYPLSHQASSDQQGGVVHSIHSGGGGQPNGGL